ncbi:hypothetical protein FB561_2772 [Kribbella amoyensis]|uniref:DUF4913 domain-containing protein n=1 Tax=Kribbella amoyensis TaxID=996641 RepID=A0A561BS93_9ACTN|nr:hypothetical protein [Kribbella amoyensis]TWD81652.1 hypothetical protein FB561_2772 [Kribbella amoyensis]
MKHNDHEDPGVAAQRAVSALARTVEALGRDVQAMRAGLRNTASAQEMTRLAKIVTELGEVLTQAPAKRTATGGDEDTPAVRSWLVLAEDQAAVQAVLSELLPWLQTVYLRYKDGRESLPVCWLWHPEIVEELLWLMDAWTTAFHGEEASVKLAGDWHDRQRPGVAKRVTGYGDGCSVLAHRDPAGLPAVSVPLMNEADPFVAWWATDRDHNGPAPTPEQVAAGRRGPGLSAVPDTAGGQR